MLTRIIALALLVISSPAWAESTNSLTTGFDYSTGKYGGTTSTDILYVPVTGKMQFDSFFLKLTVPYISVTSAGDVLRGIGKINTTPGGTGGPGGTGSTNAVTTQSGLGDVVASAGYTVLEADALMLDLVGKIKFGTADADKNLGTGENDYSAQVDGYYTVHKTTLFATAGYTVLGSPVGVSLNNIAYGTLGLSQKTGEQTSVGVMLDAAQASNDLNPGTRELSLFVSNKISPALKLQAYLLKGFSDSSPDLGGGIILTGTM